MCSGSVPLAGKLTAVLENHTAQWVILLIASFVVLFAGAHESRLSGGDAQLYGEQARLIAEDRRICDFAIRPRAQSPRAAVILAHGLGD
jgi:hypothetical protein